MPILDEIETFFSKQHKWQQSVYAELRSGNVITEELMQKFASECIKEVTAGKTKQGTAERVVGAVTDAAQVVRLTSIENVERIDRLAPQQTLRFAHDGLTIVYGDNGSGKTGYGRILRQVCQARGVAPSLRGNIFLDTKQPGSADVIFSLNGYESKATVRAGTAADGPLRNFSIFDTSAATSLVNDQNATAFRPFGLDLLDRFTVIADDVKRRIEKNLAQSELPFIQVADYPETTSAGKLVRELTSATVRKTLDIRLVPLTDEREARRKELAAILAQARANDPTKLAQAVNAKALRYQQLVQRLEVIAEAFFETKIARFTVLRQETMDLENAAEVARNKAFSEEALKEVGAPTWRLLWDAARAYSSIASAGKPFSEAQAGDLCPLCAQPLSDHASTRMQTLEAFVKGELQSKAKESRKQLTTSLDQFNNQLLKQAGDDALFQELTAENETAASEGKAFLVRATQLQRDLQVHHAAGDALPGDMSLQKVPSSLSELPLILRQRAVELQKSANASTLSAQQSELAELDTQSRLAQQADVIKKEVTRILTRQALEAAKKTTSTRAVSELSKELTVKHVSDALCDRFRAEVERLSLHHLEVQLASTGAQKGKLFHRIMLRAKQDAPLREVVSEGEFRCIALAAFLAEVGGGSSGILFDDPVSSLDHSWRNRIAIRLAEESQARQVIVFTHDIVFHFLLREAAESPAIKSPFTERCVERRGKIGSGFCRDEAPWAGLKTKARIGALRNDLVQLEKEQDEGDPAYERNVRDWYGRLRESWERAVEECLLKDAVRRFSHSVKTNSLKEALQKIRPDEDWAAINKGMTKASAAIRGHDGAAELNPPVPSHADATQDLADFDAWVKTKN